MIGPITPQWQRWPAKAPAEDRLHWRVTEDLTGAAAADLTSVYLTGDLTGADLGGWERGPYGYARRVEAPRG